MVKLTFMGAGSTVFAKNVIGDCFLTPSMKGCTVALYDIDPERLDDSRLMIETLNANLGANATVQTYCGVENRKRALAGADFVTNAIQVGGYEPSTVIDFEIPKKYGLRQTIADTLGIGGIFRSLRTIPVVNAFGLEMQEVCPKALFINYVNPMAMIAGAFQRATEIQCVGLCHSVQGCARHLLAMHGIQNEGVRWEISGINHMAWLTLVEKDGIDLYPQIKDSYRRAREEILKLGGASAVRKMAREDPDGEVANGPLRRIAGDMVRQEMMLLFGYYVTESSEHNAEYAPYWIRRNYPELIDRFGIPLDEYPRRCVNQIEGWKRRREELTANPKLEHRMTHEYASNIIEAILTDVPFRLHGNVLNTARLIPNLPDNACVEVPIMVDRNGLNPCYVGPLPEPCAAMNRTNINVQLLTIEAALTGSRAAVYQAALLDPHTAAELSIDEIIAMCDDLIEAHGDMLPTLR